MKTFIFRFGSIIKKLFLIAVILVICSIVIAMSQGSHPKFFGYQVLRVLTSSMQPAISENTCIIIKEVPEESLKEGDIITFVSENSEIYGYYNTHRIHEIREENGEKQYITKGDANDADDAEPVSFSQITGVYVGELPGGQVIGKIFVTLSDSKVYFLVVMLPLGLCLLSYLWQIIGFVTNRGDDDEEEVVADAEVGLDRKLGESDGNMEDEVSEDELEKTVEEIFNKQSHNINR